VRAYAIIGQDAHLWHSALCLGCFDRAPAYRLTAKIVAANFPLNPRATGDF